MTAKEFVLSVHPKAEELRNKRIKLEPYGYLSTLLYRYQDWEAAAYTLTLTPPFSRYHLAKMGLLEVDTVHKVKWQEVVCLYEVLNALQETKN